MLKGVLPMSSLGGESQTFRRAFLAQQDPEWKAAALQVRVVCGDPVVT